MKKDSASITIHDIASELGLHASTVSRALNDNPAVSKKTRALIQAKAKAMNYRPNRMAAALRKGRSDLLGVIVPAIDRHFFASVIRGIEEEADKAGLHVMFCQSYDDSDRERKLIEGLQRLRVDGILLSVAKDGGNEPDFYQSIIDSGTPVHFFDNAPRGFDAAAVVIDDRRGAYLATKHLVNQGVSAIAHLRGPQHLDIYRDRFKGYQDALLEAGMAVREEFIVDITSHFDNGRKAFAALWSRDAKPTGIFSASDYSAAGVMQAAQEQGLKIPRDLAVIGFANEPFTDLMTPTLSSVDQQTLSMGRKSTRRMIAHLKGDDSDNQRIILEPSVIERGSSRLKQ
ncbi:LacI family DNA-binding transcriptional regulator [Neolewinella antarctica]|uniref:LacI family transcriptional regulator n=1 Tax=Neolewinella antarctica TaxID=442734 RepID=A0ABX0X796_9BACT|nr:LacI family DNA-binding transcriptional regulator [Neolewinella antarctica]NJC25088.1 LacI family transcriptional regulator [Neolewinella antarctica]